MIAEQLYHIFNRGNNKQPIFFQKRNYIFFEEKLKKHIYPHAEILAYCLMPNHFHLLISTNPSFNQSEFTIDFRLMLSSYTRAINKQEQRSGSLFQQYSKIKVIEDSKYSSTCFHYIHQNPMKSKLVSSMEDWAYSSFNEYLNKINGLANKELATTLLDLPTTKEEFLSLSYNVIIYDNFVNDEV